MRRNEIDAGSQPIRNILTNPAFEAISATKDMTVRTNLLTNPSMRAVSVTPQVMRTNLISNPAMELSSGNVAVRTNLCTNPGAEYSTSNVAVRTNLVLSPRGVTALTAYGTSHTVTPNVTIANHPQGFTTALRVSYDATSANPGVILLPVPEASVSYYMSAWVYHETVAGGTQAFAQSGVTSQTDAPAIVQGVWQKISWVRLTSGTSSIGFRVSSNTGAGSFLITGMQIEKSTIPMPYFDALTTTLNLAPNPSMEASTGTVTVRTNYVTNPSIETGLTNIAVAAGTGGTVNVTRETTGGYAGTSFARATWTVGSTGIGGNFENNPTVNFGVNTPASLSVYVRVNSPQRLQIVATGTASTPVTSPFVDVPANTWTRLTATGTVTVAGTVNMRIVPASGGFGRAWVAGDTLDTDAWLLEAVGAVGTYFDGSYATSGDFTYSWSGTAHASMSLQKAPNAANWGAQWYGNGGGTGYMYRATGAGISGGNSLRKVWAAPNTTSSLDVGVTTTINVTPGATYTSSIYQKSSFDSVLTCYVVWKDSSGATIAVSPRTAYTTTLAGSWVRASCTETAPSGAYSGSFIYGPYTGSGTIPVGATIDWDRALIEETDKLNPYYDGSAAAPDDFTYLWNGVAHNSTSLQRAAYPFGFGMNTASGKIYQTGTMSHLGTKSIVSESVAPTGYSNGINFVVNNLPAGTYTFSAYVYLPQAYGTSGIAAVIGHAGGLSRGNNVTTIGSWQRTKTTVTTTSTQNVWFYLITDGVSAVPSGAKFYADSFQIEAGTDASPYFDGANAPTNLLSSPSFEAGTSGWSGAGSPVGIISQDPSPVYSGTKSLKIVVDGTFAAQGAYTSSKAFVKPNRWYTASVWIFGDAGKTVRLELGEWDDAVNLIGSRTTSSVVTLVNGWQRLTVSRLMGPTASLADVVVRNNAAVAHTFWIDAAQLEEGTTASDYPNTTFTYAWTGTANNSTSEQRAAGVTGITYTGTTAPYQSSEQVFNGSKSLYFEGTTGDLANVPSVSPTVSGLTIGTTYTYSAWIYLLPGSVGVELQPSGIAAVPSGRTTSATGVWQRVYHTFDAVTTSHILRIRTQVNGKVQMYVGATMLEQSATLLPYFDGANPAYENIAWPTTQAMTGSTVTTGISYNGLVWSRVTASLGTGGVMGRNIVLLSKLVKGQPYTASVTVANDGTTTVTGALDWCDGPGTPYTLAPGETKRISTTGIGIASRGYDPTYRFADLTVNQSATEQKSVLFKDWLIEMSSTANNYYAGTGDFTYAWTGTANNSTSNLRSTTIVGTSANKSSIANARFWVYQSTDETGQKVAKWLSPAGTPNSGWRVGGINNMDYANIKAGKPYTMYFRYRATGYAAGVAAPVQLCGADNGNQVMGALTGYNLNLGVAGWQTFRRTFTANVDANGATIIYLNLPATPDTLIDQTLEISEAFIVDNSYSGAFFDGSTVSADPDFAYAWNGVADASTSKMLGSTVTGVGNNIAYGQGISSTAWRSSGTKSVRILSKNILNNDSFVDLNGMFSFGTIKPNTKYTIAGTRYISAPLTGTLAGQPGFRVNIGGDRSISYKPGYTVVNTAGATRVVANFTTGTDTTVNFVRLQHGAVEGVGDVWWDNVMLVEGDYDGRHIDGSMPNSKWDGAANASTSVGYPTTLEGLIGMPLFSATTGGNWALDSSKLSSTAARTFYTVADSKPLSSGGIDVIWVYGQDNLSDTPANQSITFRYQSESTGNSNSILSRRTGGAGAIRAGVPSPSRYIMVGGIDENGYLFSGHPGSPTLATDNLKMIMPHERFQVYADNSTHTHIATYIYAGVHDAVTRALVYKLLAQRHNVPLLV